MTDAYGRDSPSPQPEPMVGGARGGDVLDNMPHDEEFSVSEEESVNSLDSTGEGLGMTMEGTGRPHAPAQDLGATQRSEYSDGEPALSRPSSSGSSSSSSSSSGGSLGNSPRRDGGGNFGLQTGGLSGTTGGLGATTGALGATSGGGMGGGDGGGEVGYESDGEKWTEDQLYKPGKFAGIESSAEVAELFQYIGRYKPADVEIPSKLQCFIPDMLPAVGDIDTFIKVPGPTPTEHDELLGLVKLDEPSGEQSDPLVLQMQLRALSKVSGGPLTVGKIERAHENPHLVDAWIKSVEELHRHKPPPQIHYTKSMPDIEPLMQVWPREFEELLDRRAEMGGPYLPAEIPLSLEQYARAVCNLVGIPVYENVVESLHLLFTLYLEFKENPNFQGPAAAPPEGNDGGGADVFVHGD